MLVVAARRIAATWQNAGLSLLALRTRSVQELRPIRLLIRISVFGLIAISASGIGHALLNPVREDSSETATVVTSLVGGGATLDIVPPGFEDQLGYLPVPEAGTLVNPKGGCSTPGGVGPDSFDTACRVHDFGYDILRYAEGTGTRVGPWARFDLDRRLYADLLQACDTPTCGTTATVYYTAVTLNSIRQGYVAPTTEPLVPWAGTVVGVVGFATATAPAENHRWKKRMIGWSWTSPIGIIPRFASRFSRGERQVVKYNSFRRPRFAISQPSSQAGESSLLGTWLGHKVN